ncbi:anti-sigma factor [Knoellia sp. CPCC 206450]|uniref:anti-sigma factor n=1 Tax=Knoellia tibetensis TaxID=3404798 RepID=UPI003B42A2DE
MNPDTHALAGAYAVNAVTEEERRSFELHLGECADCRAEVAELRAAAATIAADVELPPPPALRASVLSAVSQTRQLSPLESVESSVPARTTAPDPTVPPSPAAPEGPADSSANHSEIPQGSHSSHVVVDELAARRRNRMRPWLAAAVAAAVLTVGGLVWQPWRDDAPPQLTATEQVLQADDAQRLELPMGTSEIALVRSPSHKQAVFVADAMPTPPSGKAYQLWFDVPGQGMVSAGMIPTSGSAVTVMLQGDASTATGAGITLEPESGSEHPTSNPVALFSFA